MGHETFKQRQPVITNSFGISSAARKAICQLTQVLNWRLPDASRALIRIPPITGHNSLVIEQTGPYLPRKLRS